MANRYKILLREVIWPLCDILGQVVWAANIILIKEYKEFVSNSLNK